MRKLKYILLSIISITFIFSSYQFYKFQNNSLSYSSVAPMYESLTKLELLNKRQNIKNIKSKVEAGQIKEAYSELLGLEQIIYSISGYINNSSKSLINKDIKNFKNSLNLINVQSDPKKVYMILTGKLRHFQSTVRQHGWRTLTRLSNVALTKVKISTLFSEKFFSFNMMRANVNQIQKLYNKMEEVTRGSVLSNSDKSMIISQLKSMAPELNLLRKYLYSTKNFNNDYKNLLKNYNKWNFLVSQKLKVKRSKLSNSNSELSLGLLILSSLLLISLVTVSIFSSFIDKENISFFENNLIRVLDSIVTQKKKHILQSEFSETVKNKIEKYETFMKKRMSLGDQLKEGTPFPTAIFDANLNLVWGNKLFYNSFELDENEYLNNEFNWSLLKNKTNLGEVDPLITALGEDLAGIYQMQLNNIEGKLSPFEMYVTPIVRNNSRNIQVTMYPLSGIEDTLDNQLKTLVSPIIKSVDAIFDEHFDTKFRDNIKHEFDAAGVPQIYTKLQNLNENFVQQKHGLLNEVERLENENLDKVKQINDSQILTKEIIDTTDSLKESFSSTKNEIVKIIDTRYEEETLWGEIVTESKKYLNYSNDIFNNLKFLENETVEVKETISMLSPLKNTLKIEKSDLEEMRGDILRLVEQEIVNSKISGATGPDYIASLKLSLKKFDNKILNINKILTNI